MSVSFRHREVSEVWETSKVLCTLRCQIENPLFEQKSRIRLIKMVRDSLTSMLQSSPKSLVDIAVLCLGVRSLFNQLLTDFDLPHQTASTIINEALHEVVIFIARHEGAERELDDLIKIVEPLVWRENVIPFKAL